MLMDADVMNNTRQFVLYPLQSIQCLFGNSVQHGVAIVESRMNGAECNRIGLIAFARTMDVPKGPNMKITRTNYSVNMVIQVQCTV